MQFLVQPSALTGGDVRVPGDKSISHRALMLGAVASGQTNIEGFLAADDCLATLAALRAMGVQCEQTDAGNVSVQGVGIGGLSQAAGPLDLGNSGTALRLFAGLLSGQQFTSTLTGDASLTRRPMNRVIKPLCRMGADIDSADGLPPLTIHGPRTLTGMRYEMPVASAQVKSALLLAGLQAAGETVVCEPATSRDHTERMLRSMGVTVRSDDGEIGVAGGQQPVGTNIQVPGDLSSAAFLILAALIAKDCEVTLHNIGINPTRTGALDILRQMGADLALLDERLPGQEPVADIRVRSSKLHGIEVDPSLVSLAIDEFPALFIAAAAAEGRTRFSGIGELRVKESDRIGAMATGLRQLGIRVEESADGATVHGGRFDGGTIQSCGDHRIAMSFAVAATVAQSEVKILDTSAVNTSFPGFVECLNALGGKVRSVRRGLQ